MTEEKSAGPVPSDPEPAALPSIDFSTLVLSLATSAMVHMGLVPETEGGPVEKNLALAHQTIDTLEMLQTKTRGNLSDDETKLLQSVLYELRMGYVKARG
jgi:Domain of unknown function (DUF1844)